MKKIFFLIFFAWFLFYIFTPPFQTPDEEGHYENIFWFSHLVYPQVEKKGEKNYHFVDQFIPFFHFKNKPFSFKKVFSYPLIKKTSNDVNIKKLTPKNLQAYHPPLYPLIGVIFFKIAEILNFNLISQFYFTRLLSAFFYFLMVFITYKILRIIFKQEKEIIPALLFFSLNPQILRAGISINPDIAVSFFSYLFLYFLLIFLNQKLTSKEILILSFTAGLATLSKFSGIFNALVFIVYLFFHKKTKNKLLNFFMFFMIFFITLLPWILINLKINKTPIVSEAFITAEYRNLKPLSLVPAIFFGFFELRHTLMHYAGFLGATNEISPPKIFFVFYSIFSTIFFFLGAIKNLFNSEIKIKILLIYLFSLLSFLLTLGIYFKILGVSWDLQGRYFIPGFLVFTIFVSLGFGRYSNFLKYFSIIHFLYAFILLMLPNFWEITF
jgi:4-amino-4-deoxy-L-arabinose transferase-like glycosyltransferase